MHITNWISAALVAAIAAGAAHKAAAGGTAMEQFRSFTNGLQSLSAGFEQRVYGDSGRLEETSSGTVKLQAPDLLHWQYREPFPQLIVADGERVWVHDRELDQITVREQRPASAETPLVVLTDPDRLEQQFKVDAAGVEDGLAWLELRPRDERSDFRQVRVGMREGSLQRMVLEDKLGQVTEIEFTNVRRNPELDAGVFEFEPPDGVDVLQG